MHKFGLILCLFLIGCVGSHQLSHGRAFKLSPVSWSQLVGWQQDNLMAALPALKKSCWKPQKGYERFCSGLGHISSESALRTHLEKYLMPYRVESYGKATGTITGYYEAEITGSRFQKNPNQFPIYGLPVGYNSMHQLLPGQIMK